MRLLESPLLTYVFLSGIPSPGDLVTQNLARSPITTFRLPNLLAIHIYFPNMAAGTTLC